MSICLPEKWVLSVYELSLIVGKMQVYHDQEDSENYRYMEKYFYKKCEECEIDVEEFEGWWKENKPDSETEKTPESDDDNCDSCVQ